MFIYGLPALCVRSSPAEGSSIIYLRKKCGNTRLLQRTHTGCIGSDSHRPPPRTQSIISGWQQVQISIVSIKAGGYRVKIQVAMCLSKRQQIDAKIAHVRRRRTLLQSCHNNDAFKHPTTSFKCVPHDS